MTQARLDRPAGSEPDVADRTEGAASLDPRRLVVWSLVLFVAVRCCIVVAADTPSVTPDEFGAWAVAQYLSGHSSLISMRDMPHYPLVPGMVLTPLAWLDLPLVAAYRTALVLLSAMTVAAAALVRRALLLVVPGRSDLAAVGFAVVLLFPATLVTGSFTWAEPTVVLWWAALMWAVARLAWRPSTTSILVGSVVAGAAPFVHGRLTAVPLVWTAALVLRHALDRREAPRPDRGDTAAGVATTLVTALGARALDQLVVAAVWTDPGAAVGSGARAAGTGPWWKGLATALAGQGWYLLAATGGLALVGMVHLLLQARRPDRAGSRLFATTLGAMVAANLAISVLVTAGGLAVLFGGPAVGLGGTRGDHLVYGRYIDGAALVLAVVGLAACWDRVGARVLRRVLAVAAGLMVVGALAVSSVDGTRALADTLHLTIGGVAAFGTGDGLQLARWTAVGLALCAALAVAIGRGRRAVVVVTAAWLVLGAVGATLLTVQRHHERSQPDLAREVGRPDHPGDVVLVARDAELSPYLRLGVLAQQRDLTHLGWRVEFTDRASDDLGASGGAGDVRAVVLVEGERPEGEGWSAAVEYRDVAIWRR